MGGMKDTFRPSHRNGSSRAGVSDSRRVPCSISPENHGFHPEGENCTYCDPLAASLKDANDELDEPQGELDFGTYFWP
jgi:hypothetical protein